MNVCFDYKGNKGFRLLNIYERLQQKEYLSKAELAADYSVSEKTIQRDIDDLRAYLIETHIYDKGISIKYDKTLNKYYLNNPSPNSLSGDEVLSMCKILLENCSLPKERLSEIIKKIIRILPSTDRSVIYRDIAENLKEYYSVQTPSDITLKIWDFTKYSQNDSTIFLSYKFPNQQIHNYIAFPIAVVYKNNVFYLVAFTKENIEFPTVFNINQIVAIKLITKEFTSQLNINELKKSFRKDGPFELKNITFKFSGNIIHLLSKFPTASIVNEQDKIYTLRTLFCTESTINWLKIHDKLITIL